MEGCFLKGFGEVIYLSQKVVVSHILLSFHPYLGKMNPFWRIFFNFGWNHQVVSCFLMFMLDDSDDNWCVLMIMTLTSTILSWCWRLWWWRKWTVWRWRDWWRKKKQTTYDYDCDDDGDDDDDDDDVDDDDEDADDDTTGYHFTLIWERCCEYCIFPKSLGPRCRSCASKKEIRHFVHLHHRIQLHCGRRLRRQPTYVKVLPKHACRPHRV